MVGSQIAKRTSRTSASGQRLPMARKTEPAEPVLQLQRLAGNAATTWLIQRLADKDPVASAPAPDIAGRIRAAAGRGAPLPDAPRTRLEGGLGADLSGVRIHADGEADSLSRAVRADAFTTGRDMFFSSGAFSPSSVSGFKLLAHEAAHVVQQDQGPVSSTPMGGGIAVSHPSDTHERAADAAASSLVAGEPAHATGSMTTSGGAMPVSRRASAGNDLCIQRHSSWEHMLIGDLSPEQLATIGANQEVTEGLPGQKFDLGNGKKVDSNDVQHVIEQEIRRLSYFQTNPPTGGAGDVKRQENALVDRDLYARNAANPMANGQTLLDNMWDVKLVSIPSQNGRTFMVTYGELNTLADFFGSVTEMSRMDPSFLDRLIRGVRQSTANELTRVYMKVAGIKKESDAKKRLGVDSRRFKSSESKYNVNLFGKKFGFGGKKDDSIGMGGGGVKGIGRELNLMGALPLISRGKAKPTVGGNKGSDYSSTLARNACHFAPESWHSWTEHHEQALNAAEAAHVARTSGNDDMADQCQNQAMLYNGFGDHYLQDSYAGGHLINKTQIMAFYARWLDTQPFMVDFHKDKNWRKVQDMAYGQSGLTAGSQYDKSQVNATSARNPQAVTNTGGTWQQKAQKLGLTIPDSVRPGSDGHKVLSTWQAATLDKWRKHGSRSVKDLTKMATSANLGLSPSAIKAALGELIADGVVRNDSYSVSDRSKGAPDLKDSAKLVLREAYIPKNAVTFNQSAGNAQKYEEMATGVAYNEYLDFMNSSFLQKATNALHNKFCEEGLTVSANSQSGLFKIYGDDAMLNRGASKGLLESGITAKLSRDSIIHAAEDGRASLPYVESTQNILNRLPAFVEDESSGGARISLADWHNQGSLEAFCAEKVFPPMSKGFGALANKFAPGVVSSELGKIDDRPDKRDVF